MHLANSNVMLNSLLRTLKYLSTIWSNDFIGHALKVININIIILILMSCINDITDTFNRIKKIHDNIITMYECAFNTLIQRKWDFVYFITTGVPLQSNLSLQRYVFCFHTGMDARRLNWIYENNLKSRLLGSVLVMIVPF